MAFLSPLLLAGAALVAVPIVLHLVMRRQARQVMFPALQFVQKRRESNRRKMQLRHWLLLALRCALIAGLAFALARPALQGSGLRGKEGAPLAVAVVVDNSLRMQYVHQSHTRLEEATETAQNLVGKLPEDSMVAVCDLGRAAGGFAPDLNAATSRLRNLRAAADSRPLTAVLVEAITMVADQDDRRQEVFVFTDLTKAAWPEDGIEAVKTALAAAPDVRIYVFDAGVAAPKNAALGELSLVRSVLRPGEPLKLGATVTSNVGGPAPLVELSLQAEDGRLEKRGQQLVELDANGVGRAAFADISDLPLGTHQGSVRLTSADPLAVDNTRYFTVEVRPPSRVLLLADRAADAKLLRLALEPPLTNATARFSCTTATFDKAAEHPLEEFQAVLLLDPPALAEEVWKQLDEYAAGGGGVGVFLGHNADFNALNGEVPQRLLAGKLLRVSRDVTYLRPRRLDHPALAGLRNYDEALPWRLCQVYRYWQLSAKGSDAYAVATFANDDPAILERASGRGRLLTMTTPVSDPMNVTGREPWNALLSAEAANAFVPLGDQIVGYLAQDAEERLGILAGETARLRLGSQTAMANYVLRTPDGQASGRMGTSDAELAVSMTDQLGNYRLTAGGESKTLNRGFSVNASSAVSELARIEPKELLAALPKEQIELADSLNEVEQYVDVGREGRELYPWAIALVAIVWGAEHVLANRFYRQPPVAATN